VRAGSKSLVSLSSIVLALGLLSACGDPIPDIVLNEFVADNATGETDEAGEFADWIELHNPGSEDASLAGFALSDDSADPLKHTFAGDLVVPAGGYLVLFADQDVAEGSNHVRFRLSKDGEAIYLSWLGDDGGIVAIDSVEYGVQDTDTSAARVPDETGEWVDGSTPTPGASNG